MSKVSSIARRLKYTYIPQGKEANTREATKNSYALVVEAKDRKYSDILTSVMENNDASKSIQNLRSTKKGNQLIVTEKNEKALVEIQKLINVDQEPVIARVAGPMKNGVHLLNNVRPTTNNTKAAILTINKVIADTILQKKEIRVGMVNCKEEQQLKMNRCYKCWLYDHTARDCNGPDRS
ncbi:hypothetical protein HHI36_001936 [Cryptolaemus montrouzieri]|uniref:CCHC-type domain-containing protein n=1 Tax=Cryptolaemus montrouzieri TaxID=559131 RepID=A0ABD2PAE3_9CUCU